MSELAAVEEVERMVTVRVLRVHEERTHPILVMENERKFSVGPWYERPRSDEEIAVNREGIRRFKTELREAMLDHYNMRSIQACRAWEVAWQYGHPKGPRGVVEYFETFLQFMEAGS